MKLLEGKYWIDWKYRVAWCPSCNQGWVHIYKSSDTGKLFCCCDEAYEVWDSPELIGVIKHTGREIGGDEPTEQEIENAGWSKYLIYYRELVLPEKQEDCHSELVTNAYGETYEDRLLGCAETYRFMDGKIYAVIGKMGQGGELISQLLCGLVKVHKEKIKTIGSYEDRIEWIKEYGCYIHSIETYRYVCNRANDPKDRFKKNVFCFPWLNQNRMQWWLKQDGFTESLHSLTEQGALIVIPTESRELLDGIADEFIELG